MDIIEQSLRKNRELRLNKIKRKNRLAKRLEGIFLTYRVRRKNFIVN